MNVLVSDFLDWLFM